MRPPLMRRVLLAARRVPMASRQHGSLSSTRSSNSTCIWSLGMVAPTSALAFGWGGGIVRSLFQVSSWISDEASWLSHRSRWRFVQRSSGLYIMAMFGNSTAPMAHCFRAHPKTRVMPIVGVPPLWHVVWDIGRLWLHHRCATIVGLPSSLALVCRLQRLEATERGHMNTHGESEVVPSGMQARSPSQSTQPLADAW